MPCWNSNARVMFPFKHASSQCYLNSSSHPRRKIMVNKVPRVEIRSFPIEEEEECFEFQHDVKIEQFQGCNLYSSGRGANVQYLDFELLKRDTLSAFLVRLCPTSNSYFRFLSFLSLHFFEILNLLFMGQIKIFTYLKLISFFGSIRKIHMIQKPQQCSF